MIGMIMMLPALNFQENVNPTRGSVTPGTPGGGGLPTDTSIPTLALSLALVPFGLSAVAVFPPFARWVKLRLFNLCNDSRMRQTKGGLKVP